MSDILSHELMLPERENLVDTLFDLLDEKGNVLSLDDQGQIPVTGLGGSDPAEGMGKA